MFSDVSTEFIQCFSCTSSSGSACDDEFNPYGKGVKVIQIAPNGDACTACTKDKADAGGVQGIYRLLSEKQMVSFSLQVFIVATLK